MNTDINKDQNRYARPHDAWQCSLDEWQSCGGTGKHSADQPECSPAPSMRMQRGIFTLSCTAMLLGLLLACWNSPLRNEFLAPGPLTKNHAQILVGEGTDRCAACHGAGNQSLGAWIQDAVSAGKHIPVSQSQLCMDCHKESLTAACALQAHNLPAETLARLTAATAPDGSSNHFPDPRNAAGELACATCHREHHGAEFNLTALTDQQCQTCHVNYVHSFELDHPEFNQWPFTRRSNIAFDHVSHGIKHFAEKNQTFDCRKCHIDDDRGNVKMVAPFETSCAECHQQRITGDKNPQWTILELPMLDIESLESAGYSIGLWPDQCTGDFDGEVPPAMKLLLMAHPRIASIMDRHGLAFQFGDLDPDDPEDLADANELAWSIKELLFGLAIHGERELKDRLNAALDIEVDERELRQLTQGLNEAVFAQAQQRWIPGLLSEMNNRNAALDRFEQLQPNQIFARPQTQDDETLAVNPLAELYGTDRPATPDLTTEPSEGTPPKPAESESPKIVVVPPSPSTQEGRIVNRHSDDLNDDLLANNPLANLHDGAAPKPPIVESDKPSNDQIQMALESALQKLPGYHDESGWYRNDQQFRISWRVADHIDPLIKSWTDLAMKHHGKEAINRSRLFETMNSPNAAGQCRSCHTANQLDSGEITMSWGPTYRNISIRGFTRFSHRPHDIQTTLQDCNSCHQLDETRCNADSFASFDPADFISNFAPLSVNQCASCHRAGGAPGGCVDCHNYHIGSPVSGNRP